MNKKPVLCIIGARQNSKRLPGKNKKELAGKPLFWHTLRAARQSNIFRLIIFSSDDPEILAALHKNPAPDLLIDNRPKRLAKDKTIFWEVALYVLKKYAELTNPFQDICLLTPCHPFRQARHIKAAFDHYQESQAISLISITPFPSPPGCRILVNDQGWAERNYSTPLRKAEHDAAYYPNGAITFVQKDFFLRHRDVFSPKTFPFELPWPYSLDIDEQNDLDTARQLADCLL